jgi:hypothetical protein
MDRKKILEYRGIVVDRFINIDTILNALISLHYFKEVSSNFILEVLYDEYFSFALKRRIVQKIIPNLDSKMIEDLNRLNTIRNYFAHCGMEFVKDGNASKVLDPRNLKKGIDFEALFKEFMEKEHNVANYFLKLYIDKGGMTEKDKI